LSRKKRVSVVLDLYFEHLESFHDSINPQFYRQAPDPTALSCEEFIALATHRQFLYLMLVAVCQCPSASLAQVETVFTDLATHRLPLPNRWVGYSLVATFKARQSQATLNQAHLRGSPHMLTDGGNLESLAALDKGFKPQSPTTNNDSKLLSFSAKGAPLVGTLLGESQLIADAYQEFTTLSTPLDKNEFRSLTCNNTQLSDGSLSLSVSYAQLKSHLWRMFLCSAANCMEPSNLEAASAQLAAAAASRHKESIGRAASRLTDLLAKGILTVLSAKVSGNCINTNETYFASVVGVLANLACERSSKEQGVVRALRSLNNGSQCDVFVRASHKNHFAQLLHAEHDWRAISPMSALMLGLPGSRHIGECSDQFRFHSEQCGADKSQSRARFPRFLTLEEQQRWQSESGKKFLWRNGFGSVPIHTKKF
jgi:hypothetical protein